MSGDRQGGRRLGREGEGGGALAWLSHMRRLTRMVSTLQTLPITEKEVAEMTARSAKEK